MSVVPPPMSTSATPSSFSSDVRTDSLAASCSSTVSTTSTPARFTQATMFCIDDEAASRHADRHRDAVLIVDDEVLWQHVQNLAAAGQRDRAGRIDRALHV